MLSDIEHQMRNALGRWLRQLPLPPGPDEGMEAERVLLGLRCLWDSVPPGGKSALARALAMKDRQQLSAIGE
jgi:hypothetical protein